MTSSSTIRAYSTGAIILHWLIAALIITQIIAGFIMSRTGMLPTSTRFSVIQWHKTIGIAVLALTLARIGWRLIHKPPAHAPMRPIEHLASVIVHALFYILMLALPLSGWLMVSTSKTAIPTLLFLNNALVWPHLPVPAGVSGVVNESSYGAHSVMGYIFAALIILHVAGALKHSLIDRAPSLARMAPFRRLEKMHGSLAATMVALVLSLGFIAGGLSVARLKESPKAAAPAAQPVPATDAGSSSGWIIDKEKSTLSYEIDFSGAPVKGEIGQWNTTVTFDPQKLDTASASMTVQSASITYNNEFVSPSIAGEDGLSTAQHPTITVSLNRFAKVQNGFTANGTITIRGVSLPVEVPFSFRQDEKTGRAYAEGTATLDRLAYGLGKTGDGNAEWLGKMIRVRFAFEATSGTPKS